MKINLLYNTNKKILSRKKTKSIIKKIVNKIFENKNDIELNFLFTENKEIKKFNKKFLNKNSPTDVLCFKYDKNLADIIISIEQIIKNAKTLKVSYKEEFVFTIIHSILHFRGMNDDTVQRRNKMLKKGKEILEKLKKEKIL